MAALITLADAKEHLRITDDDHDGDIQLKVDQASAIVVKHLKSQADPTWDDTTVPLPVQSAIFLMLTHLYEHRGDDMATDERLWEAVQRLLVGYRDPALA